MSHIDLIIRLAAPGELDADDVLEPAAQLLLSNSSGIDHPQYNTILLALIEKVMQLEEEIVQLKGQKT